MTGKRLFRYALIYKKIIIAALLMLSVAVAAELTGPFIAKRMIDTHILGIEKPWHQVEPGAAHAVQFRGEWYKREDRLETGDTRGSIARIVQAGRDYVFVDGEISFDGKASFADGEVVIQQGDRQETYSAVQLNTEEIYAFYKPEIRPLFELSLLYLGLLVVAAFFHYFQRYWLQQSANRIIQRMRNDVFGQIGRLPVSYFDHLPAGKVLSRITNDTEVIRELYVTVLATFFTGVIYMTGIYIALFLLEPRLALISLLVLPILVIWLVIYRKIASHYNHRIRSLLSDMNGTINETIQGMPVIRSFRKERMIQGEFEELNGQHFNAQSKLLRLNALTSHNLVGVMRNLAFALVIWYFAGQSLSVSGAITFGVLYAFVDYLNRLFQPVTDIVNQFANLEQARVAAERVFELMDQRVTEEVENLGDIPDRYHGDVRFEQVHFAYQEGKEVLKGLTFEAKSGETVALVGHTGSGKSSTMNLLFRFYDVTKGRITIDGKDIRELSHQRLRKHMGIVLQDPFLFTGTIASNVSLNDPEISDEQIKQALIDVGAESFIESLPQGIHEAVKEKGSTLSAGQRQLISFARALAYDPAILILDEATSSVDTETEAVIQRALDVVKKGRTTFIIAHRLSTIREADQILVLDQGEIAERGTHAELMGLKGKYYMMYQMQIGAQAGLEGKQPIGI